MQNTSVTPEKLEGKTGKRVAWVDFYRAIMIFMIVLGHALSIKGTSDGALIRYVYSFHVTAFFFISGYMFKTGSKGFVSFLKRKFFALLIPYYVFSLLSIGIFVVFGALVSSQLDVAIKSTDIVPNLIGMLYGNGASGYMKWNLPLWFIPCMFAAQLLFYGIAKVLEKLRNSHIAIGVTLLICLGVAFLNYYVLKIKKLPFGLETVINLLPFMVVGYWLRSIKCLENPGKLVRILLGVVLIAAGALIGILLQPRVDYPTSRLSSLPLFYVSATMSVIGFMLLAQALTFTRRNYMGAKTLAVLVMHKFPIVFMQMILPAFIENNRYLALAAALTIATVACLLSLMAGQIIEKICPPLLGEKRKRV